MSSDPLSFVSERESQVRMARSTRQPRLALGVWLAVAVSVAMSFVFWRMAWTRPHAVWGLISVGLVATATIALFISTAEIVIRGRRRFSAIGWLLVGITPLVWIGALFTDLSIKGNTREPLVIDSAVRITVAWASSILDLHARWKYPRWTPGKHVVLIDSGQTPDAQRQVAEMDGHLLRMATLLQQPMPDTQFAWVRGSLVGQNGRAIMAWGLCGHNDNPDHLTDLDRHEMAHTLITQLGGPDHDPPFLLAEGWAESQSADRDSQIIRLADAREAGRAFSLAELVGPDWYGTGHGPVYWEGGPVVHYLIEHYGPKKFFELYRGVRRETFHEDCVRILGDSWETVENEFWPWLERESRFVHEQFAKENVDHDPDTPSAELKFAPGVDPQDWQELVAGYQAAYPNAQLTLPNDLAVLVEMDQVTSSSSEDGHADEQYHYELKAAFKGEDFWATENYALKRGQVLFSSDGSCACLSPDGTGRMLGRTGFHQRYEVRQEMENVWALFFAMGSPSHWLQTDSEWWSDRPITIAEVRRPAPGSGEPWTVAFEWHDTDGTELHYQLEIQPALDWAVTRSTRDYGGPSKTIATCEYQRIRGQVVPLSAKIDYGQAVARTRWRELTSEEARQLRQYVEHVAVVGVTPPYHRTRQLLALAVIGVPSTGILGLILGDWRRSCGIFRVGSE